MEKNRIQKLLLSDYKEFSDLVLLESPFAETTRNGRGVREVALGLTSSKLIIAADILHNSNEFTCPTDLDPSIETLELISIYPLEYITLSIFRRRQRKTLKARLIDGRANYFELGGMNRREIFWSLWCEHIQILLSQKEHGSSLSETTAASSSSTSTLYFQSSDADNEVEGHGKKRNRCICRLWAHYYGAGDIPPTWTRKDIYMGPSHNKLSLNNYLPVPIQISKSNIELLRKELQLTPNHNISPKFYHRLSRHKLGQCKKYCNYDDDLCEILFTQENHHKKYLERGDYGKSIERSSPIITNNKRSSKCKIKKKSRTSSHDSDHTAIPKLSRFGFGVEEQCTSGLYLPSSQKARQSFLNKMRGSEIFMDPYQIIEGCVAIWEQDKWRRNVHDVKNRSRKFRRYGLATAPHFLYALGPWSVYEGDKISIQSKRSLSSVNIRKQPREIEFKLPISKRQLTASVSMSSLEQGMSLMPSDRGRVLLFWTPDYWYRPRAATTAYRELRQHLDSLRDFQRTNKEKSCRKFFSRKNNKYYSENNCEKIITCDKATCILNRIFSVRDRKKKKKKIDNDEKARSADKVRNLLRMNSKITAWDLDSTTLAKQLTLIDRDLFLRIPVTEIKIVIYQQSSRNAPNVGALIAFSHRISCLISSELLAISKLNMRTRILARFINAANKCFAMGNFQSCKSILAGLQSPAIYRLKSTWSHLKTHHSSNYEIMSKLCKIFKSPRTEIYINAWKVAERSPPLLPYIGDILIRILGLDKNSYSLYCECPEQTKIAKPEPVKKKIWDSGATFITQISEQKNNSTNEKTNLIDKIQHQKSNINKNNMCKCKQESEPTIKGESIAKKIISSTLTRLRYGKYTPIKSQRKSIFWAAEQLLLARRYCERWQRHVITARIIAENKKQKKSIDMKRKKIEEVTSWLTTCQRYAHDYNFSAHVLAWEFLLKARYREERENFENSRKLEPLLD